MKNILSIAFICFTCCIDHSSKRMNPVYDSNQLKMFVLKTASIETKDTERQLDSILQQSSGDSVVFRQTVSFLETPFSHPNSAYRNEQLYLKLLKAQLNSDYCNLLEKEVVEEKLKLLQQNNVGHPANDFIYKTSSGIKKRMYNIQSIYTLIYFNNPECNACKQMKKSLAESIIIGRMLKSKELTILAMYVDSNEKLLNENLNDYPKIWLQGRDEEEYLYKNKVYDLKAIPSLHLLNAEKIVLIKDAISIKAIEDLLITNYH